VAGTSRRDACGPSAGETPALPAVVPFGCHFLRREGYLA